MAFYLTLTYNIVTIVCVTPTNQSTQETSSIIVHLTIGMEKSYRKLFVVVENTSVGLSSTIVTALVQAKNQKEHTKKQSLSIPTQEDASLMHLLQ